MNSWKVILATVVIFGAGVMAGGLLVQHSSRLHSAPDQTSIAEPNSRPNPGEHDPHNAQDSPRPRPPEMLSKQFLKQLDSTLKLTSEQHDAIQKILADGQEENARLWKTIAPDVRKAMQEVREKIRAQLTPEQFKQFETLMKQSHPPRKPPATNLPPPAPTNAPPDVPTSTPAP